MLEALKKKLAGDKPQVDMKEVTELATALEAANTALALKSNEVVEAVAKLATFEAEMATQAASLAQALEQLAEFKEQAGAKAAKELADKLAARKAALSAVVGDDKAASMLEGLAGLDDKSFEVVVNVTTIAMAKEEASPMFQEIGASEESADKSKVQESLEMKLLKAKYSK
jgi:hypothetical protein